MMNGNEGNKRSNDTFLQKFKGRTNKIDKNGISFALDPLPVQKNSFVVREHLLNHRKNKAMSIQNQNSAFNIKEKEFNIDLSAPKHRQPKYLDPIATKRSVHSNVSHKIDLPPILPLKSPKSVKRSAISYDQVLTPPSRPASDKAEVNQHRIFGKYLKLDEQALKHFEFLLQIDKKREMRKNSAIFSDG